MSSCLCVCMHMCLCWSGEHSGGDRRAFKGKGSFSASFYTDPVARGSMVHPEDLRHISHGKKKKKTHQARIQKAYREE